MKVLLINGSPRRQGCTYTALSEVASEIEKHDIETEILWVGNKPIAGCTACRACATKGRCVTSDDVNELKDRLDTIDGIVVGSPVYYASAAGGLCSFLDRAFYSSGGAYAYKPAAAIVSCRRGGASATFDRLNKYFTINSMPVVASQYWNSVHGNTPDEVRQDLEGMQVMRRLGANMAWILKCVEAGKAAGITPSFDEERDWTNFIR